MDKIGMVEDDKCPKCKKTFPKEDLPDEARCVYCGRILESDKPATPAPTQPEKCPKCGRTDCTSGDSTGLCGAGEFFDPENPALKCQHINLAPTQPSEDMCESLDRLERITAMEGRLREAVLSARKAFECVRLNDKTVYNYEGDGAKNKDGRIPENGRWSTPLEIAEDEIKLIDKAITASPEASQEGEIK